MTSRMKKTDMNKKISLIVFFSVVIIVVIIFVCMIVFKKKYGKDLNEPIVELDQPMVETITDITNIEVVNLVYGMDGSSVIEIPSTNEISNLAVTSDNENIVRAYVKNNEIGNTDEILVIVEAISNELGETTINVKYNDVERKVPVYVRPSYLVEFNTYGGSFVIPQKVVYEGKAIKPDDPTKERYVFSGWYLNEQLTEEYDFDLAIVSDLILYAKFESNE